MTQKTTCITTARQYNEALSAFLSGSMDPEVFRVYRVERGIYEQRGSGRFMARVRCIAGQLTADQLTAAANTARQYGSPFLHLTTRQEIQLHNLQIESTANVLHALARAGLTTLAGGGNCLRNITCSPATGSNHHEVFNVIPQTTALTHELLSSPYALGLPRKFKIALSSSEQDDALARFHDLGFIACLRQEDSARGFRVYLGGGASNKPRAGFELFSFAEESHISAIAHAALELFHRYGNRNNKSRARLRHLVAEWGEERTRECFFDIYRNYQHMKWSDVPVPDSSTSTGTMPITTIPLDRGNLSLEMAFDLAQWAKNHEQPLHFTRRQSVLLSVPSDAAQSELGTVLRNHNINTCAPQIISNSISCTGAGTCRLGICRSQDALLALQNELKSDLQNPELAPVLQQYNDFEISISGCPNACGHHLTADLGFAGTAASHRGTTYPAYQVFLPPQDQKLRTLSQPVGRIPAKNLPAFTRAYLAAEPHSLTKQQLHSLLQQFQPHPETELAPDTACDWGSTTTFTTAGRGQSECAAGASADTAHKPLPSLSYPQLTELLQKNTPIALIDVRQPYEHEEYSIGGTLIPLDQLPDRLHEIPRNTMVVLYCRTGHRSGLAQRHILDSIDHPAIYNLSGGIHHINDQQKHVYSRQ